MNLITAYGNAEAVMLLYALLAERPTQNGITHKKMPSIKRHSSFMKTRPYRYWLLIIEKIDEIDTAVGALEVLHSNEIGVAIFKRYQRHGYASKALRLFMATYDPLPARPAVRNGHWLANIAVGNEESKVFFGSMGFVPLQETYVYAPE